MPHALDQARHDHGAAASAARQNLARVLVIRLAMLPVCLLALLLAKTSLVLPIPLLPLGTLLAAAFLATGAAWWWLRHGHGSAGHRAIGLQLLIDVAILTGIVYPTGGWTNPLVSLYLVPIAAAAALLPARWTTAVTAAAVLAYSVMTRYYQPIFDLHHGGPDFALHVTGMWLTFVLCAVLLAYFGTRFADALARREQALAEARETNLRNEQIIGMATLAAGTAHELSTPLATMAVITAELGDPAVPLSREDIHELARQVDVCREILVRLREAAEPRSIRQDPLGFVDDVADRFRLLRPETALTRSRPAATARAAGAEPARAEAAYANDALHVDPMLRQALLNLLDNAANASPAGIRLDAAVAHDRLRIEIRDQGTVAAGQGPRRSGLGVGLLLANTTIERHGGTVSAAPAGGGTLVVVTLPLAVTAETVEAAAAAEAAEVIGAVADPPRRTGGARS